MQTEEATDRPRIGFHQSAELFLHDHLEVEFHQTQRGGDAERRGRTRNHFDRVGSSQVVVGRYDGRVKLVTKFLVTPRIQRIDGPSLNRINDQCSD